MQKKLSILFASAAMVVAAACGSSDSGPSFATAADSATIDEFALNASDLAASALNDVFGSQGESFPLLAPGASSANRPVAFANTYVQRVLKLGELRNGHPFASRPLLAPSFSAPFSECNPTETGIDDVGDPIDTDADGIPDDYKINFGTACVSEDSAGTFRETISGSIRLQDTNLGFFSFRITVSSIKIVELNLSTGDKTTISLNGSEAAQFAAALASHAMNLALAISETPSGGSTISVTENVTETSSFDPDGAGVLSIGGDLPAGNFDYSADFRIVGENSGGEFPGNFRFVLSTPTVLHYNPACGSQIDSGVFRGLMNGSSSIGFTLTWSSCADPVLNVFGDTAT